MKSSNFVFTIISLSICTSLFGQRKDDSIRLFKESWCGTFLHVVSDSVAFCISGCEAHQSMVQLNYKEQANGELVFQKVKSKDFEPINSISYGKVHFSGYDSLFMLPKVLIVNDSSRFWSESYWKTIQNGQTIDSGLIFSKIELNKFRDTSTCLEIISLDNLTNQLQPIYLSNYPNPKNQILVKVLFPVHFLNYSDLNYSDKVCDLKRLKMKRINGQLFILNDQKKWESTETFKGFTEWF